MSDERPTPEQTITYIVTELVDLSEYDEYLICINYSSDGSIANGTNYDIIYYYILDGNEKSLGIEGWFNSNRDYDKIFEVTE